MLCTCKVVVHDWENCSCVHAVSGAYSGGTKVPNQFCTGLHVHRVSSSV